MAPPRVARIWRTASRVPAEKASLSEGIGRRGISFAPSLKFLRLGQIGREGDGLVEVGIAEVAGQVGAEALEREVHADRPALRQEVVFTDVIVHLDIRKLPLIQERGKGGALTEEAGHRVR